jgi:glycosyltransferase involved in cell wall biosynthesis
MANNKIIIASFIDQVAPKNKLQIDILYDLGYRPVFFVNVYHNKSAAYFLYPDSYFRFKSGIFHRMWQVSTFFKNNRKQIHHAEIYPGSRFSFVYLLIALFFRVKVICVERGDLLYFKRGGYDMATRISMWFCYHFSSMVWYRELYMEAILKKMGIKNLYFIHNAIDTTNLQNGEKKATTFENKKIDFLWVNRLIPERMSGWFVDILHKEELAETHNVLAGMLSQTLYNEQQRYVQLNKPKNLELVDFIDDPTALYQNAKFFVLPAEVVFANNALLEAMSYGVVPVIVNSLGYELLVEDGVSGIVSEANKAAYEKAIFRAHFMPEDIYNRMSIATKQHIIQYFSAEVYRKKLNDLYNQIEN